MKCMSPEGWPHLFFPAFFPSFCWVLDAQFLNKRLIGLHEGFGSFACPLSIKVTKKKRSEIRPGLFPTAPCLQPHVLSEECTIRIFSRCFGRLLFYVRLFTGNPPPSDLEFALTGFSLPWIAGCSMNALRSRPATFPQISPLRLDQGIQLSFSFSSSLTPLSVTHFFVVAVLLLSTRYSPPP